MNKDLKDRVFKIPDNIIIYLKSQISNNNDVESTNRAKNLIQTGTVTYGQLKKIVHDIKYIDKNIDFKKYNLYGGELMEKWGNLTLNNERALIKQRKTSRKRSDDIGAITGERKNAFLQTHSKKSSNIPTLTSIKSNSNKNTASSLNLSKLFEEVLNDNK